MYRWQPLLGKFEHENEQITFHGEVNEYGASIGNIICDQRFSGGLIEGVVQFKEISEYSSCQIIVSYQPASSAFVVAGIDKEQMFSIRSFFGKWMYHSSGGERSNLIAGVDYHIKAHVMGSRLTLTVDGVNVLVANLPFTLPYNQVGIWCNDFNEIYIKDYVVSPEPPMAFVVMQFTKPYNELYSEIIKPICEEFGIKAIRADETFGTGIIITDIARQITDASFVVAEITPSNPNVYYEVGYSHALNKPTILIAEKGTELPFDVSPFRILFYENTIEGKRRAEEGFRKHLTALQSAGLTISSS